MVGCGVGLGRAEADYKFVMDFGVGEADFAGGVYLVEEGFVLLIGCVVVEAEADEVEVF